MRFDPDKYAESLFDAGAKQPAPILVVAAVHALLRGKNLKWCLPQMWNDKANGYATHWRVLGRTKKRLLVVSAWSPDNLWTGEADQSGQPGNSDTAGASATRTQATVTEAWTRPLTDIETLICDDPRISAVGRRKKGINIAPAYAIKLRGREEVVPISARATPRPEDHTAAAEFADYLLATWP